MKKTTIGVLMIVKNEQVHLENCLESVKDWVDEIVIVDSGSTDNTAEIAAKYTDKFYVHSKWPGFGKQRQIAQSYMQSTWVLALDADEVVTEQLKETILNAVKENNQACCYKINRLSKAFGSYIKHSGWSPDWVLRLYPRTEMQYNDSLVHEQVDVPKGYIINKLEGNLLHFTFDNLSQYTQKTSLYISSWVDQREGRKKASFSQAISHGFFRFIKMYFIQKGFLDGRHGLLLAILSANVVFTRYADLWLRDYVKKNK
ncbi:glycosyltransferase family 2 protein [Psychromonas aquatilis]|uniref:Glycosyltransferase family 2 protein n=1 Tax=Psychromonas aquatilis TaxID=2005072 RepID=A0ABU9GL49_9GAMM